jgi:hypothetical protein
MQLAHVTVKHAGKHHSAVRRLYVSVAEVVVLQKIHGEDAIDPKDVVYAGVRPAGFNEMEHLLNVYGKKDETKELVERLFPGAVPTFPTKISDIGLNAIGLPAEGEKEPVYDPSVEKEQRIVARQELKENAERRQARIDAVTAEEDGLIRPPRNKRDHRSAVGAVLG